MMPTFDTCPHTPGNCKTWPQRWWQSWQGAGGTVLLGIAAMTSNSVAAGPGISGTWNIDAGQCHASPADHGPGNTPLAAAAA